VHCLIVDIVAIEGGGVFAIFIRLRVKNAILKLRFVLNVTQVKNFTVDTLVLHRHAHATIFANTAGSQVSLLNFDRWIRALH